mgnify:CR=1 FL=1
MKDRWSDLVRSTLMTPSYTTNVIVGTIRALVQAIRPTWGGVTDPFCLTLMI